MEIFGGTYQEAVIAPRDRWNRYPYRRTEEKESFSQAIFRLMGIPEVSSDLSGNVTVHQILRLLYADQLSPVEDIFRFERFDQTQLRDTVGRLLCGAYDSALYDNELAIRRLSREFDAADGQLRSLFTILGGADHGFTSEWIEAERRALETDRTALDREIEDAESSLYVSSQNHEFTLRQQNEAYAEMQELQSGLSDLRRKRDRILLDIADSDAFIRSLQSKIEALQDTARVAEHLGDVVFDACPACYAPLAGALEYQCHVCKAPYDGEQTRSRIAALVLDNGLQLRQSEELQRRRASKLDDVERELMLVEARWRAAATRLSSLQRLPTREIQNRIRVLNRRSGYLDRQREDLERKAELVSRVRDLSAEKERANAEIVRLRNENEALKAQQQKRLAIAYTRIADEVKELLRRDLDRQDVFEAPDSISFTFGGNRISVDGESYFSASSRAILKSSFFLGFLAAATKTPFFRHPRFCMIDTHENMGVEAIRSQNFQLQMLRVSQEAEAEHQIIYATAMIEPELEDEVYTIGDFSTNADKTLDMIA